MNSEARAEAAFAELARKVADEVRALPKESCIGFSPQLTTFWEEFKYQVQREESVAFDLCEDAVRLICRCRVQELDREQLTLIWAASDARFDRADEIEVGFDGAAVEALENELYARVYSIADTEELAADPDEERDRERLEEDFALSNWMMGLGPRP